MIEIISPDQFKQTPWKNGKGFTTELAINDGGTLSDFEWRISIASVTEDGVFSDFSGYLRNLVLIEGNGISLTHNDSTTDNLEQLLSFATFDGANKTFGTLISGPINDFNLMAKTAHYQSSVETYLQQSNLILKPSELSFIYSIDSDIEINNLNNKQIVPAGFLIKVSNNLIDDVSISGSNLIVATINKL